MRWYCEKCKKLHNDDELCPRIKQQLKQHPEWMSEISDFTIVAGERALITGQKLDKAAQSVNRITGKNLSYEGTQQFARDIQVFKRLNEEPFSKVGAFASPENARNYFENVLETAENKPCALASYESKLTGYGQEVDWLRMKKGEISSLYEKNELLTKNAPGVDGITFNRFTGKEVSRTTIKASKNPVEKNSYVTNSVKKSIEKQNTTSGDIIFAPIGTESAAQKVGLENPVIEKNTTEQINNSNKRLQQKIKDGQATTVPTVQQVGKKMLQGAVVGAAVAVTVSTITNYVRYKNSEITGEEAFSNVAEDTIGGALVGAALGAVTIFIPAGAIGFVAGMAIGIYFNTACTNILDEVFGKGAYGAILNASGYVYGMTYNLAEYYKKIEANNKKVAENIEKSAARQTLIESNFDIFEQMKG
jgi:hypothetical protein